jgi:hypothetical protein
MDSIIIRSTRRSSGEIIVDVIGYLIPPKESLLIFKNIYKARVPTTPVTPILQGDSITRSH